MTQVSYSKNLWDPRPLKDCEFDRLVVSPCTPFYELIDCFNTNANTYNFLNGEKYKEVCRNFKYSLDYNYIRGTRENPQINLFRFKEALAEFGITRISTQIVDFNTGRRWGSNREVDRLIYYTFVDDSGRPVDFNDQPI